jgi:enoyl-CoA hydratase/carnithine racemase
MPYEHLIYDKQDHIALVTLNRPERLNALSRPLHLETLAAAEEARNDDDV